MRTTQTLSRLLLIVTLGLGGIAAGAELSLSAAKQQGLVGEQADGYVGAVAAKPSPKIRALVAEVNGKRRAKYTRIGHSNSINLANVEALAGQKAIDKTATGLYIKPAGQGWRRK